MLQEVTNVRGKNLPDLPILLHGCAPSPFLPAAHTHTHTHAHTHTRTHTHTITPPITHTIIVVPVGADQVSLIAFITVVCVLVPVVSVCVLFFMCVVCKMCRKTHALEPNIGADLHDMAVAPILEGTDTTYLQEKIGQGRFASVWKAVLADGRLVAVKVFQSHGKDSWQREIDIFQTADLQHKNILLFLSSEIHHNEHWLLTEYHPQGSLYDLLHRNTVTLAQFCIMAETAALG